MKKCIALILLVGSSLSHAQDREKGPYFLALSSMSNDASVFSFMIDQYLENKCGKAQTIDSLNQSTESYLQIALALKGGNYKKAKTILNSVPCAK